MHTEAPAEDGKFIFKMLQIKMPFVTPNSHVATFSISGLSNNINRILLFKTHQGENVPFRVI